MSKVNLFPIFIAILLTLLILPPGCITIVTKPAEAPPPPPPPPPVINTFSAEPQTITAGGRITLSWNVSNAETVNIQPEIGAVGATGSLMLSPASTTTYTLTATSATGSQTASVTVTVVVPMDRPDLVITEVWLTGSVINYRISNRGSAPARATWAHLYVNNLKQSESFVDILAPGEERVGNFSNWQFLPLGPMGGAGMEVETKMPEFAIRVCADATDEVGEAIEDNNCLTEIWGQKFSYDFVKNAHLAKWRSSAGDLKWPMVGYDTKGAAYLLYDMLVMCPEQASQGWIMGRFAEFYVKQYGLETTSREIEVPQNARFTAKVGFGPNDVSTDGVSVALGYLDATGSLVLFPKMDVYSDGTMRPYEVDLSGLAGRKTEFILWVEAKQSPQGDCVRWAAPKIVQE